MRYIYMNVQNKTRAFEGIFRILYIRICMSHSPGGIVTAVDRSLGFDYFLSLAAAVQAILPCM